MKITNPKFIVNITKLAGFLLIIYILFLLGKSLWTNYNLRKSINELNKQIISLNDEKKNLENLNIYYQSDSFKELEARRKLGLKAAGEKVLLLSLVSTPKNFSEELQEEKKQASTTSSPQVPNWALWWNYFTK